jgi:hypothetical protein
MAARPGSIIKNTNYTGKPEDIKDLLTTYQQIREQCMRIDEKQPSCNFSQQAERSSNVCFYVIPES